MFRLSAIPHWYLVVAVFVSAYQAWRGYMIQKFLGGSREEIKDPCYRAFLLCLADGFTYFVTAITGFVSLFWFYRSVNQKGQLGDALLIFLVLYGVLGVTGKLPDLLSRLYKFPS